CYSAKRVHLNLVKKHPNLLPARQKRPARPQSFGDSRKAIKIYRALKNTHSSAATGSPRAGSSGGRARTVSASSQSRSACGGGGRARTVSTDSRVYRKPTPKSRREAEDKRRRTSTPKAKKSANNTLAMSTNVSADEVVVDGVVHSMLDAVLTDDNMSQESNTGANKDSQEPAMYSSDVSISENEYNFCEFSVSSDDSDTDKDFKPSVYYKNKIKIPVSVRIHIWKSIRRSSKTLAIKSKLFKTDIRAQTQHVRWQSAPLKASRLKVFGDNPYFSVVILALISVASAQFVSNYPSTYGSVNPIVSQNLVPHVNHNYQY
ncbi:unnamed protein product, partial [Oppiella nova]